VFYLPILDDDTRRSFDSIKLVLLVAQGTLSGFTLSTDGKAAHGQKLVEDGSKAFGAISRRKWRIAD